MIPINNPVGGSPDNILNIWMEIPMALKDILVHVDDSNACANRVQTAIDLAQAHGAHLTGLYVLRGLEIPVYAEVEIGIDVLQAQKEASAARAKETEAAFKAAIDKAGMAAEWRCVDGPVTGSLVLHGRHADLLILGQSDPDDVQSTNPGVVGDVVLEAGRPVMVIPYIGASKSIGKHVMVAWNASREAVRAANDALALLEGADHVSVLAVNPESGASNHGDIPSADICLHLARHGVKAEARSVRASDIDVGDLLLSRAADEGADLIVMGAYGHSRLREIVLGGATRHLLKHMTVPVLLSH